MTPVSEGQGTGVRDLLLGVAARLGSATEARWVVDEALGSSSGAIAKARTGAVATAGEVARVEEMVERRLAGEPLQYVLGNWQFRTLDLAVDPRVLIPRPETEVVVGHALDELERLSEETEDSDEDPILVVELGTGSGAIALSIAVEGREHAGGRPLRIWATEADGGSLEVARANKRAVVESHPWVEPVEFVEGSWFDPLPESLQGRVGLIVANPPYISEKEWGSLDPVVRDFEPRQALVSGPLGTEAVDYILENAPRWLGPHGALVVEIAPHQADDAGLRAIVSGFDAVIVRRDFADRSRALVARLASPFSLEQ